MSESVWGGGNNGRVDCGGTSRASAPSAGSGAVFAGSATSMHRTALWPVAVPGSFRPTTHPHARTTTRPGVRTTDLFHQSHHSMQQQTWSTTNQRERSTHPLFCMECMVCSLSCSRDCRDKRSVVCLFLLCFVETVCRRQFTALIDKSRCCMLPKERRSVSVVPQMDLIGRVLRRDEDHRPREQRCGVFFSLCVCSTVCPPFFHCLPPHAHFYAPHF